MWFFYLPLSKVGLFGLTDCSTIIMSILFRYYPPYPRGQTPWCKGKMNGGGAILTGPHESLTTRTVKIVVGVSRLCKK